MFDHDKMKRLKFFEALRFVVAFAVCMAVIAAVAICGGCTTGPDGGIYIDETVWVYVTNRVDSASAGAVGAPDSDAAAASASSAETVGAGGNSTTEAPSAENPSGSASISLDFRYGGFKGGNAKEDSSCQITSISVSSKGVTFKLSGSWWGATHDDPTMRCCAFYKDGAGKWVGGFWEWGSPDRKYRAFTNIDDGYKGWDSKAFRAAKELAFVICSKDGKKRSNIVTTKGF